MCIHNIRHLLLVVECTRWIVKPVVNLGPLCQCALPGETGMASQDVVGTLVVWVSCVQGPIFLGPLDGPGDDLLHEIQTKHVHEIMS